MAGSVFAPKYAQAFATVAASAHLNVKAAQGQMNDFARTLDESKELHEVMTDPSIPAQQKLDVLDALAERLVMYREVRNFFAVIIDHQRVDDISAILTEYHKVADAGQGVTEARITSAHALGEDARRELEQQVSRLAGTQVNVEYAEDSSLLGGAVVRIGSTVYDGSVRAQLEQMKQNLLAV